MEKDVVGWGGRYRSWGLESGERNQVCFAVHSAILAMLCPSLGERICAGLDLSVLGCFHGL